MKGLFYMLNSYYDLGLIKVIKESFVDRKLVAKSLMEYFSKLLRNIILQISYQYPFYFYIFPTLGVLLTEGEAQKRG